MIHGQDLFYATTIQMNVYIFITKSKNEQSLGEKNHRGRDKQQNFKTKNVHFPGFIT